MELQPQIYILLNGKNVLKDHNISEYSYHVLTTSLKKKDGK